MTHTNNETIGVGAIHFYFLDDLREQLAAVRAETREDYAFVVLDNSESFVLGQWRMEHCPEVAYIKQPYNVGTSIGRNRLAEWFAERGMTHFVVMDGDVRPTRTGWLADMRAVFDTHPDTGVVGWAGVIREIGCQHEPDATGRVPEMPSACCMYSMEAVRAAGGWCPEYFLHHGEDTDFCLNCGTKGYKSRVVLGVRDKVKHVHPHQGTARFGRFAQEQERSKQILLRRTKELGFARLPGLNT